MYLKQLKFFAIFCIFWFTVACGQQKQYAQYKVQEGESMRDIAKKLDMKTKDLVRLNPTISRNPDANTIIVIPKRINTATETQKTVSTIGIKNDELKKETITKESKESIIKKLKEKFVIHEVKKGDTFYSLTRFYNLTNQDLVSLNPELSEGLKLGQIIKIKPIDEGNTFQIAIYEDFIEEDTPLKVALLLPFNAKENDSLAAKDLFTKSKLANIVTDFYLGAEIAIDSLRKQGAKITLSVFDTQKNNTKIDSILGSANLNKNNVIIGPLYSEEVEKVANRVNIPVVFPFYSKNQSKFTSSKIIKTSPEKNIFREELITYIKDNFKQGNIILVGDGKESSNVSNTIIKQSLELHSSTSFVNVIKPKDGYIAKKRFLEILKPKQKNWVILTSDNNVLVADAINSFISLPDSTDVRVFTYNKGSAFDKIANLKLAKVSLTYVSDEYTDENSLSAKLFTKQYVAKNNALPSFHSTKGFDITYDVLMRLASGEDLKSTFKEGASFRVESKFDYFDNPYGVSENKGLFIIKYNKDLSLTRLK